MDLEKDISLNYVNKHKQYDKETKIKILKEYKENNLSVSEILKKYNISASCFYRWRNIFEKEGESGFIEKSRKPKTTPLEITDEIKTKVIEAKKLNPVFGTKKIRDYLFRNKGIKLAVNTVHKILVEAGLKQAPDSRDEIARSYDEIKKKKYEEKLLSENFEIERFERKAANDLWQIDITTFYIRGLYRVYLIPILDDHSRFIVNFGLYRRQTEENVLITLKDAFVKYGLPKEILMDQGRQFTAFKGITKFERLLKKLGIYYTKATAHHPQTTGKIESFNRNIKAELIDIELFHSFEHAFSRIAAYIEHYNYVRPHQGIGGFTPADRYFGVENEVKKYIEYLNRQSHKSEKLNLGDINNQIYITGKFLGDDIRITSEGSVINIYVNDKMIKSFNLTSRNKEV